MSLLQLYIEMLLYITHQHLYPVLGRPRNALDAEKTVRGGNTPEIEVE